MTIKKKLPRCLPQQSGEVVRFSDYEKPGHNTLSNIPQVPCEIIPLRIERGADDTAPSECPCL